MKREIEIKIHNDLSYSLEIFHRRYLFYVVESHRDLDPIRFENTNNIRYLQSFSTCDSEHIITGTWTILSQSLLLKRYRT